MSSALTFNDLLQYNDKPPASALPRTKAVSHLYSVYLRKLKANKTTPGEVILKKIFEHEDSKFIITENKFPYNIADNLVHLVVWINPLFDATVSDIRQYLDNAFSASGTSDASSNTTTTTNAPNATNALNTTSTTTTNQTQVKYVLYKNLPAHASIDNVDHYHLFMLRSDLSAISSAIVK